MLSQACDDPTLGTDISCEPRRSSSDNCPGTALCTFAVLGTDDPSGQPNAAMTHASGYPDALLAVAPTASFQAFFASNAWR